MTIKYIAKIEKATGQPILFFPEQLNMRGPGFKISCYTLQDEHNEAGREYMQKCCYFPKTIEEIRACNDLRLHYWKRICNQEKCNVVMVLVERVQWRNKKYWL